MNKKLVALAVAGVFALPMAAQAQTANVTLYGRLNLDMEAVRGTQGTVANNSNPTVYRVSTNSSRFGIKGAESLGGGLSAIFQIENSVVADASGGTIAGRETFVGLQGTWGTFKMGRFLAPYDDIHPIFGNVPTLTTSILSTAALWGQGTIGQPENGGFDDRVKNSIRYDSPNIAGFTFSGQYGGYECQPSCNAHAGVFTLGGYYTNGPFQAGIAYELHHNVRSVYNAQNVQVGGQLSDWGLTAAAGYNFGWARLAAVYERLSYDTPNTYSTGQMKRDLWGVSGTIPLGPGTVYASWERQRSPNNAFLNGAAQTFANAYRVGNIVGIDSSGANHYTLSYTYPLSKRTLVYAGWTYINNSTNGVACWNSNPYPGLSSTGQCTLTPGGDPNGILGGMVHFF